MLTTGMIYQVYYFPLGECHCGCGGVTTNAAKSHYIRLRILGFPVRFIPEHSNRHYEPVHGLCHCGCNEIIPRTKLGFSPFFNSDHVNPRSANIPWLLTHRRCVECKQARHNSMFPAYKPGFEYPCSLCQDKHYRELINRQLFVKYGHHNLCKCGCGWAAGPSGEYIDSHSSTIKIRHAEKFLPVPMDFGYSTPCLVRKPDIYKARVRVYSPEMMDWPYVEELAWIKAFGLIEPGQNVFHKCGITACENIGHLELVDLRSPAVKDLEPKIGYGYCQCGCGMETSIAKRTYEKRGWKKGEPLPLLPGHHYEEISWASVSTIKPMPTSLVCNVCGRGRPSIDFRKEDEGTCKYCSARKRLNDLEISGGMMATTPSPAILRVARESRTLIHNPTLEDVKSRMLYAPLPYGHCRCGCGAMTKISNFTDEARGYTSGMHFPFVRGHSLKARRIILPPNNMITDRTKICDQCKIERFLEDFDGDSSRVLCNHCSGSRPRTGIIVSVDEGELSISYEHA